MYNAVANSKIGKLLGMNLSHCQVKLLIILKETMIHKSVASVDGKVTEENRLI